MRKTLLALTCALAVVVPATPAWAAPGATPDPVPGGTLDPAFGTGGKVLTDFPGGRSAASDVAVQPDGKLVAVGRAVPSFREDIAVARYNPDGSLDTTFGTGGTVLTGFSSGFSIDVANAVAIHPDGRIVAAGSTGSQVGFQMVVVWYRPDGTVGTVSRASFGDGVRFDSAEAVAVQRDGKVVVAGITSETSGSDFALARFTPDGLLDPAFGSGGLVRTDVAGDGGPDHARAMAIQSDGRIVAVGSAETEKTHLDFALARYLPDGTLDRGFGRRGVVRTDLSGTGDSEFARAVAIQPNGRIVAAGSGGSPTAFALTRYRPDGRLDRTFGTRGVVLTTVGGSAEGVAVQPNRKIVAVGSTSAPPGTDVVVIRYGHDGSLDRRFGDGGVVRTDVAGSTDFGTAVAIQPDRRIVVAAASIADQNNVFALVRYLP